MNLNVKRDLEKNNIEVFCQIYGYHNYEYHSANYAQKTPEINEQFGYTETIITHNIIVIKYNSRSQKCTFLTPLQYILELTNMQVPKRKKSKNTVRQNN